MTLRIAAPLPALLAQRDVTAQVAGVEPRHDADDREAVDVLEVVARADHVVGQRAQHEDAEAEEQADEEAAEQQLAAVGPFLLERHRSRLDLLQRAEVAEAQRALALRGLPGDARRLEVAVGELAGGTQFLVLRLERE